MVFNGLSVKNFLSLRDIRVDLGRLNIFIGPNASGKSNIVKAIRLLSNHARGCVDVLSEYSEFKDMVYNFNPVGVVEIRMEAMVNGREMTYILTLNNMKYIEDIVMDGENVLHHDGDDVSYRLMNKNYRVPSVFSYFGRNMFYSALSYLPGENYREIFQLAYLLKNISVHSFIPSKIRARVSIDNPVDLRYYGDNLPRYLLYLYLEDRKTFSLIEEAFRNLISEVEEIIPHIEDTGVEIWLKVRGIREPLKPSNISDGTLRILAIITILYSKKGLIVLEEPENYVHPYLLETLIHLIRNSPSQVIIVTHSPYLLDYIRPEEVYLVEKPGRETLVRRLSKSREIEEVRRFLEEGGTLGEAWYSGIMGGI